METKSLKIRKAKRLGGLVCVLFAAAIMLSTMVPVMAWAGTTTAGYITNRA